MPPTRKPVRRAPQVENMPPAQRRALEKRAASDDVPEGQGFVASTEPSGGSAPPDASGQSAASPASSPPAEGSN